MHCNNIILVGNGPSLLKKELGGRIDQFEAVVRFNNFVTAGFEEYVGSKSTHWCRNEVDHTIVRPENFDRIYVRLKGENRTEYYNGLSFVPRNLQDEFPNSEIEIIPLYIYERLNTTYQFSKSPLTGTVLIEFLLQIYPALHVCGFDNLNGKVDESRHYYSQTNLHKGATDWHETDKEMKYLQDRISEGRIVILE